MVRLLVFPSPLGRGSPIARNFRYRGCKNRSNNYEYAGGLLVCPPPPISYPNSNTGTNPFVREKNKIERETSENGTWQKKVRRENAFTSDFRIFTLQFRVFHFQLFFFHVRYWVVSRSMLFCFTFDFRGFHVTFSARSQPKR